MFLVLLQIRIGEGGSETSTEIGAHDNHPVLVEIHTELMSHYQSVSTIIKSAVMWMVLFLGKWSHAN